MKYCSKCGKQIRDEAVICIHCGCPISDMPKNLKNDRLEEYEDALDRIDHKARNAASFWKIFGIIQCFVGVLFVIGAIGVYIEEEILEIAIPIFISAIAIFTCAIGNIATSREEILFLEKIKKHPVKIIEHYEPVSGIIVMLILNILFGFLIGVIGSILTLSARSYVMNNRRTFKEIEKKHKEEGTLNHSAGKSSRGFSSGAIKLK